MASAPLNVFAAKVSGSSKGKENQEPQTITNAAVKMCKKIGLQKHVPLSSNNERKPELAGPIGRQGSAIAETLSSTKSSFYIHCDDKNEEQPKAQPQVRPRRGSTTTFKPRALLRDNGDANEKPAPRFEDTEQRLSRKRLREDRSQKNVNQLPSKIPRPVRSISTGSGRQKPQSCDDKNAFPRLRSISTARSSSRAVEKKLTTTNITMRDRTYRVEASEPVVTLNTVQRSGFKSSNDLRALRRKDHRRGVSSSTPVSVRSPKALTIDFCETPKEQAPVVVSEAQPTSLPGLLLWNTAYHTDLAMIEREREEREPRLSNNFLREHVNAEQRTLVVTFLLRLGMHCRYSSYIIYRAVKLFDVAIDRLQLDTVFIQLAALASTWIALKTLEIFPKVPSATKMISLAKDLYAGREDLLIHYERKILRTLNFNLTFADVHTLFSYHLFHCRYSVQLSDETFTLVYRAGGYAIDVTLLDERFCRMPASLIAISVAELVFGLVVDTEQAYATNHRYEVQPRWLFWRGLLYGIAATVGSDFRYRFQGAEIDRCRVMMLHCILNSGKKNTKFAVVWKKYNRSKYGRISQSFLERAAMLSFLESYES